MRRRGHDLGGVLHQGHEHLEDGFGRVFELAPKLSSHVGDRDAGLPDDLGSQVLEGGLEPDVEESNLLLNVGKLFHLVLNDEAADLFQLRGIRSVGE